MDGQKSPIQVIICKQVAWSFRVTGFGLALLWHVPRTSAGFAAWGDAARSEFGEFVDV